MKQCPYCGSELADDAKFCGECGKVLPEDAPVVTPAEAPVTAEAPIAAEAPVEPVAAPAPATEPVQAEASAATDMPVVTQIPSKKQMLSTFQYLALGLLYSLPVIGLIFLFIFGAGHPKNGSLKRFSAAMLILRLLPRHRGHGAQRPPPQRRPRAVHPGGGAADRGPVRVRHLNKKSTESVL